MCLYESYYTDAAMKVIYPPKLQKGDVISIIAPSRSMALLDQETINITNKRLEELGLRLDFGKNIYEKDDFISSSIKSRIQDLHNAFSDKEVKAIITVIGGFNCNQLLKYIDWDIIKNNPKIFCGFSDITALNDAIFAKTGLVTYSGPHYSSFGQKLHFEYTLEYFEKCLFSEKSFSVEPSKRWSDDLWYMNQNDRKLISNNGYLVINEGVTEGTIVGANLCTLNLLQGTEFMPDLENSVLFIEDDGESKPHTFDRDLQSLIHQPGFIKAKAIVVGRFQNESKITNDLLTQIIKTKKELEKIPIIAGVDFGHTDPKITFPIGGQAHLEIFKKGSMIEIVRH